jgi:PAS domain S-box-containing protein
VDKPFPPHAQDEVSYLVNIARDAFGHLVQGISVFDDDLTLVFFNDRLMELLDLPKSLVKVGTSLADMFRYNAERGEYGPGDVEAQVRERIELARQFKPHSFQRQRPSGVILQIDGSPMSSGGFVTTYTDITEKVMYEAFLKSIIEASPAGFGISRLDDGKLSFVNSRLADMFGMPASEMVGFHARDLYADLEDRQVILEQCRLEGKVTDYEVTLKRRSGEPFPALMSLSPTSYHNAPSYFAWVYDISSLKQAQQLQSELEHELNQAQKLEAVGQLAGGIAHEINTPSQYLWDNLKFLAETHRDLGRLLERSLALIERIPPDSPLQGARTELMAQKQAIDLEYLLSEVPTAIEQSIKGISEISSLVQAMKEFAHPGDESGKVPVDINHLLENTLTITRSEWKHLATVESRLDPSLPYVSCNPGEINQVFLNLLVNAAHAIEGKAMAGKGRISVSSQRQDDRVLIRIGDNGTGIPVTIQERIFEPFFTTREVGRGTGQGLSIARHIVVKKHGGELCFATEPGKGTVFSVTLPIMGIE